MTLRWRGVKPFSLITVWLRRRRSALAPVPAAVPTVVSTCRTMRPKVVVSHARVYLSMYLCWQRIHNIDIYTVWHALVDASKARCRCFLVNSKKFHSHCAVYFRSTSHNHVKINAVYYLARLCITCFLSLCFMYFSVTLYSIVLFKFLCFCSFYL